MNTNAARFIALIKHPVKFRLFLFMKLPSAFFAGVRVKEIDERKAVVSVPYKWFSQNPFRSTYFACLSMAAAMSTGVLALAHIHQRKPAVSMLVVKVESEYFRKAVGRTYFTCTDGDLLERTIEESIASGEGRTCRAMSIGVNEGGEKIAEFYITWSFKAKRAV